MVFDLDNGEETNPAVPEHSGKGRAIAILYARTSIPFPMGRLGSVRRAYVGSRYVSIDDQPHDVSSLNVAKAFPCSLETLLNLNEKLKQQNDRQVLFGDGETEKPCDACRSRAGDLRKCTGCGVVSYCNQVCSFDHHLREITADSRQKCQAIGWKDKDRKSECQIGTDADAQELFTMKFFWFVDFESFR